MSPFMLLLTAITVVLIGALMASVVIGNANLERGRLAHNEQAALAHNEQAARLAAKPMRPAGRGHADHDRSGRRPQVGAAPPRPAIGTGTDQNQKPALTATAGPGQQRPEPAIGFPPLGAQIRLEDGRTGSVAAIERVPHATRVHLRLDSGGHGHVDIPDTAQPASGPQPPPAPRPAPTAVPVSPPPRPAPVATPQPAVAEPEPAPAPATKVASNTTVRLGGFSVPVTPAGRS